MWYAYLKAIHKNKKPALKWAGFINFYKSKKFMLFQLISQNQIPGKVGLQRLP